MANDTLTIDFETFYSREYSLTKMTTQEYVQSPYFECILVSVKRNDEAPQWFSGTHTQIKQWLGQFDWEESVAIAHNAMFDGAILEWVFDIHPKRWFCTMLAAMPVVAPFSKNGRVSLAVVADYFSLPAKGTEVENAIGLMRRDFAPDHLQRYADYCELDVDLCYQSYLKLIKSLPKVEQGLIHVTVRKFVRPALRLDKDVLLTRLSEVKQIKEEALSTAGLTDNALLMSNPQFAEALISLGVNPPVKISPRTGKETYAFAKSDPGMKALLAHDDVRVQAIVAARIKHKSTLEETRLTKFIRLADLGKPIGVPLKYYGAHTGRFSGMDGLNMQNLPRGGELRRALAAPVGYKIVAADLSQIEARITAWMAGETSLLDSFANNRDVYCEFASQLYGRPITKADQQERFMGKTAILGLGYGMGAEKFRASVQALAGIVITLNEAKRVVSTYRNLYPRIPKLWRKLDAAKGIIAGDGQLDFGCISIRPGRIRLPNGMDIFYPDLDTTADGTMFRCRGGYRHVWGGTFTENIGQALAKIILSIAELRLSAKGLYAVLQVHDELLYCVKESAVARVEKACEISLSANVPFMPGLPVACEVKTGNNYMEAK